MLNSDKFRVSQHTPNQHIPNDCSVFHSAVDLSHCRTPPAPFNAYLHENTLQNIKAQQRQGNSTSGPHRGTLQQPNKTLPPKENQTANYRKKKSEKSPLNTLLHCGSVCNRLDVHVPLQKETEIFTSIDNEKGRYCPRDAFGYFPATCVHSAAWISSRPPKLRWSRKKELARRYESLGSQGGFFPLLVVWRCRWYSVVAVSLSPGGGLIYGGGRGLNGDVRY